MLNRILIQCKNRDWKNQYLGEGENQIRIPTLINRIESGFYKMKTVNIKIDNIKLDYIFPNEDIFDFMVHYKLIENSNLEYPIILNNKNQILDGRHRLCKAILQGDKYIKAIVILDSSVV